MISRRSEFNIDMRGMSLNWFLSRKHTKMDVLEFNLFRRAQKKAEEKKMLNIN